MLYIESIKLNGLKWPFWDYAQRRMVMPNRRSGTALKMGPIGFPRNVGTELPFNAA